MEKRIRIARAVATVTGIENKIFVLRGHRVMFDRDLAELYGVPTKALNQAVKRNKGRFPADFMCQLSPAEMRAAAVLKKDWLMRSQFVTASKRNVRYLPYVFTEHGAVMLANILKSQIAIRASIQVVRAFIRLRRAFSTQENIVHKMEFLEGRIKKNDLVLKEVLRILHQLLEPPFLPRKRPVGFLANKKKE